MEQVTLVTSGAGSADRLTEADYREIYDELRSKTTLRQFAEFIGSRVSFAWWSKYERGEAHLERERKAELRRAVGLPELPRAVREVTAGVDPDAQVWQVGAGRPDRVVLVGEEAHEPLVLRMNGVLELVAPTPGLSSSSATCGSSGEGGDLEGGVTGVTGRRERARRGSIVVTRGTWERLNAARLRAGKTWDAYLDYWAGLLEDPEDVEEQRSRGAEEQHDGATRGC